MAKSAATTGPVSPLNSRWYLNALVSVSSVPVKVPAPAVSCGGTSEDGFRSALD